jgi:carbamoyl-phosphate synthase large subunit
MPKRTDLQRILVLGSGPIVIGQGCEFDYSGTQALKALRAEGYEVVLVNSNPATIMTDPELANRTYIEPLEPDVLETIIKKERPQALLPTVGGQTALNLTRQLAQAGILQRYGVEVLGADIDAIEVAEDRGKFRAAMQEIGLRVPVSQIATQVSEVEAFADVHGYPVVIRPSFTLGGSGGGIAYHRQDAQDIAARGIELSPTGEVLVEPSLAGYKEFELEVMRDAQDNAMVVCSIENIDPMGVHTGDSVTVAPAQTLTDREYQCMRDAALQVLRRVGVATGGSNVQFAVNPQDGALYVIEMNPRVSRSSALASKATGFPIAKIAAKLAVGYTLAELRNDITAQTPAAFEPSLDYVVVKVPKFAFEKFPGADASLGTQMKSVGEVMAIGRNFKEALQKALRSLEDTHPHQAPPLEGDALSRALAVPHAQRLQVMFTAMEQGTRAEEVVRLTRVDPYFVDQIHQLAEMQRLLRSQTLAGLSSETLRAAKHWGFSDRRLGMLLGSTKQEICRHRRAAGIHPVYRRVDTCAAEFASHTPYLYSTYEPTCEADPTPGPKVLILGSGPNRIGQGIEFDYCCSHAAMALRDAGVQSIMLNCNPETVSTDYDTADRLYFEPLTFEDVMEVVRVEQPTGIIVQFGGQTPLNLTPELALAGVPILGTSADSIDLAEDRQRFYGLMDRLGIAYPPHGMAKEVADAPRIAGQLGYPLLVRPSYVLGGRAMAIVYGPEDLDRVVQQAFAAAPQGEVLIDKFLEDAREYDVDALGDGQDLCIVGIIEHIEQAGVHSGDSTSVLPPTHLSDAERQQMVQATRKIGAALGVVGLLNVQFALARGTLYVLEANPRAARTVPFVAKATGKPLAKLATHLMLGKRLADLGLQADLQVERNFVKAPVFPFSKFLGVDPKLSPEMRSTGEVMGVDKNLGVAFYKAQLAAGLRLPTSGAVLITVNEPDHEAVVPVAERLAGLGFRLLATHGTAAVLRAHGLEVEEIRKTSEGRPDCIDVLKSGQVQLLINTPLGRSAQRDGWRMRTTAVARHIPFMTTLTGAAAAAEAIAQRQAAAHREITCLQDLN